MNSQRPPSKSLALLAVFAVVALQRLTLPATPEDFGFNQHSALGARPLLVILVEFNDKPPMRTDAVSYFANRVFSFSIFPSISAYTFENSDGKFYWTPAGPSNGVLRLRQFTAADRMSGCATDTPKAMAKVIQEAIATGFPFSNYDVDGNHRVEPDELGLMLISNDDCSPGANRFPNPTTNDNIPIAFSLPGTANVLVPQVAAVYHEKSFTLMAHELTHSLGAIDLYGTVPMSVNFTLMSWQDSTGNRSWHLDPWHKLQLGWTQPRLYSMTAGGADGLAAVQFMNGSGPLLLYEPSRGTEEFFLLEYRARRTHGVFNGGYDRDVASNGLVIWHVMQSGNTPVCLTSQCRPECVTCLEGITQSSFPGQAGWRWCRKCSVLFFGPGTSGICPADNGQHDPNLPNTPSFNTNFASSSFYVVHHNNLEAAAIGQPGWRWCRKCQGMFYGPDQNASRCPKDNANHDGSTSGSYSFVQNSSDPPGQADWHFCNKCRGMFYGPGLTGGICPVNGLHVAPSGSGNYVVGQELNGRAVFSEGSPSLNHGANIAWPSGATTPQLRWLDGTSTGITLYVRPFAPEADEIHVEMLSERETWVDFTYPGLPFLPEDGSSVFPFNSVSEGNLAVSYGGTLNFVAGSTPETATIDKRVILRAVDGAVTLGRRL